jgi:acyl-CoA thioester hydrolase
VPVRFRDLDPMGHAHHTLPLVYLEEARTAFWRELKNDASLDAIDYVMVEITLRLHARTLYPSAVRASLAITRVGTKSFTTEFDISTLDGTRLSSGSAVQVAYDYAADASKPIDDAVRVQLTAWQRAYQKSSEMPAETRPMSPPST